MDRKIKYFLLILLIFHGVGIALFLVENAAPELTYANLLISALLLLFSEKNGSSTWLTFAIIFLLGFAIELIGVQTGLLFGQYVYGSSMGPLVFGTPIVIGSTWYAVVLGSAAVLHKFKWPIIIKSLAIGLLAVAMDVLIEQVAVKYGMWTWENDIIPWYNYFCWFVFGSLFAGIYLRFSKNFNTTAFYLFWIWAVFFTILILV